MHIFFTKNFFLLFYFKIFDLQKTSLLKFSHNGLHFLTILTYKVSQEEETSLNELKALLENVQHTLLEMRTKNQQMAAEITELKSSFKKHSMEISSLKAALEKEHNKNEELKRSLNSLKVKFDTQEHEINELYGQQDDLEQYTHKNSLEIHGIPENLYTSTDDVVIKIGE